jgi:hypothetical protein
MTQKKINYFNINLNFKNLLFLLNQILQGKSYLRATHNLFLKNNINLKGKIANLGSGKKNEYHNYICKDASLIENYDFFKTDKKIKQLNLEKKFILKKKYKSIILFNVLEHIYNQDQLIQSINQSLKNNGKLEIFIPFMFRHHKDPDDYLRLTHSYIKKFLKAKGFKTKITLIAAGQSNVILEILFNHLKLSFFKFPISILMIFFNFFFQFLSKDFINYYCGIHCSCVKIK